MTWCTRTLLVLERKRGRRCTPRSESSIGVECVPILPQMVLLLLLIITRFVHNRQFVAFHPSSGMLIFERNEGLLTKGPKGSRYKQGKSLSTSFDFLYFLAIPVRHTLTCSCMRFPLRYVFTFLWEWDAGFCFLKTRSPPSLPGRVRINLFSYYEPSFFLT